MAAGLAMTSFAGEWRQNSVGRWWQNDDGTYLPSESWQWLDDNRDGVAECYYTRPDGYVAANTEIDGYQVNASGAWVVDGVVQQKAIAVEAAQENKKAKEAYKKVLEGEGMDGGSFCLLDINKDGIDEMLFTMDWLPARTTIYAYQDGQANVVEHVTNDARYYDRKKKWIIAGYLNNGVENRSVHFHDGTKWVNDHASWYHDHWGDLPKEPLSYDAFYSKMQSERPWVYEKITDKEGEYRSYKNSWKEMSVFLQKYGGLGGVEYDARDTESVKNTPENRQALLS